MNIREAAIKALEEGKRMTRSSKPRWRYVCITPTNTPDCCVIEFVENTDKFSEQKAPRWHPLAEDLIADDWEVI